MERGAHVTGPWEVESAMTRWVWVLWLVLAAASAASAGELVFTNGSRVAGELSNEVLLVSTGAAVIEIAPDQIDVLTQDEIRLKDGRILRGTLVGGRLRARTSLGELGVNLDDLRIFRADAVASAEAAPPVEVTAPVAPVPAPARAPEPPGPVGVGSQAAPVAPGGPGQVVQGAQQIGQGVTDTAKGVGRTVSEGADRLHDGAKAFGEAVWEAMKSVGRAVRNVFDGS